MNFRFTAFLFVGVVALVVTLLVVNLTDAPPRPGAGLLEPLADAGIKPAGIDTVEITRTEPVAETLVFAKVGEGKWELRQPYTAKVDGTVLDRLVKGLFDAKPTTYEGLTGNLVLHGLDKPVTVTLKSGETSATVSVGATTLSGVNSSVTFVLAADRPTVPIAIPTQNLSPLFREGLPDKVGSAAELTKRAVDFRTLQLLTINPMTQGADVAALNLTHVKADGTKATLGLKHEADGSWLFTSPEKYGEADTLGDPKANPDRITGVQPLLNALASFRPTSRDEYTEQVPAADLSKYGLAPTDPGVIRVEVTPKDGTPEVLFIGKSAGNKVYCRLDGDPAVVSVLSDKADILAKTVADPALMRNRDLIPAARKPRIDAVDVATGGQEFRLRRVGTGAAQKWVTYGGANDPTEALTSAVTDLIDAACAPRAADDVLLTASPATFDPKEVLATVTFHLDSIQTPPAVSGDKLPAEPQLAAPKDAAQPVTLTFVQRTPNVVTVRRVIRKGAATDFLLPAPRVEQKTLAGLATRPRLKYLNSNVGSFAITNATGVTATLNGQPLYDLQFTEAAKLAGPDKARFPDGKWTNGGKAASTTAVHRILADLAGLGNAQPVAEAPPDTDLTAWGLKPVRLTVKVTLNTTPAKTRVYEFGNENPKTGKYYFRVDGRFMVLAADKFVVDTVEKADLRDPVMQRLTRDEFKLFDFYWLAPTGQTDLLRVEPDPQAKWVVKEPAKFKLDPDKVEQLVNLLESPPAGLLVPGPDKPEYKLSGEVFTAVFNRAPKPPVTVQIGAEDETKQYVYAKSSESPGVYKLPAAPFRPFLAGRQAMSGK